MINYYVELELNSASNSAELDVALKKLSMKWRQRMNAPSLDARQEAERKVQMINEARSILLDELKRAQYDDQLARTQSKPDLEPDPEITYNEEAVAEQLRILQESEQHREIIKLMAMVYNAGYRNHEFCWNAGNSCVEVEDYRQAVMWFQRSIAIEPDNRPAVTSLAFIAEWQEDYDSLKECLDWLVEHHYANSSWVAGMRVKYHMRMNQEPIAFAVIQQYLNDNPNDKVFRRDAQKVYFDAITDLFGIYNEPQSLEQCATMLDYAKKADSILSNGRSQEKLELLETAYKRFERSSLRKKWRSKLF